MLRFTLVLLLSLLYLLSPVTHAKKRCKSLLTKLHNIQAMQRNGYSSTRGRSLRAREDKARDKWWQCEQGRGKKAKKKSRKKRASKKVQHSAKADKKKHSSRKQTSVGSPFRTSNAIVIKSNYQGDKKRAWLRYYQQPSRCQRPNNLQVFAFCSEDKQKQRASFEDNYSIVGDAQ
ncbi:hypothetical protein NBRC116592_01770 [Colwellia sp. KU-HH00111]|uniref:hypothetical protein n=1 Tax=Colwellia sp. KU-HH00111 TaxID=3127652 RepID=UPI0031079B03